MTFTNAGKDIFLLFLCLTFKTLIALKFFKFLIIILFFLSCSNDNTTLPDNENPTPNGNALAYRGMDLSFQSELEDYNINYKDANGNTVELLDFVASKGTNLVRLKLWHTPQDGENGLDDVKGYAQRIKAKNMAFLLNFHYSDYWADPSEQTPPVAWQNMTFPEVKLAIYDYTKDVVQQLKDQNTLPEIIQIGNETNSGFLWDYGRVWDSFSNNWSNYSDLVSEAIRGIKEVDSNNQVKIMLHHSDVEEAVFFFNELQTFNLDFDMIGLSYYPQFHTQNLQLVQEKLAELATTFNKDILMVEVAYPFTLEWNDNQTNFIGSIGQTLSEFPPTPAGQKAYLQWLTDTINAIPNNKGVGFCYWAPDWVAFPNNETTSTQGSVWENQCLFDFDLKALQALDVFTSN